MTTFNPDTFKQAMDKVPEQLFQQTSSRLRLWARRWVQVDFARARLTGRPGLNVQTGALKRSFDVATFGNNMNNWGFIAYTDSKYAPAHEFGATIRPKTKKYLHFKGSDGQWVMTKQVKIPARLGFFDDWKKRQQERVDTLAKAVDVALDGLGS